MRRLLIAIFAALLVLGPMSACGPNQQNPNASGVPGY